MQPPWLQLLVQTVIDVGLKMRLRDSSRPAKYASSQIPRQVSRHSNVLRKQCAGHEPLGAPWGAGRDAPNEGASGGVRLAAILASVSTASTQVLALICAERTPQVGRFQSSSAPKVPLSPRGEHRDRETATRLRATLQKSGGPARRRPSSVNRKSLVPAPPGSCHSRLLPPRGSLLVGCRCQPRCSPHPPLSLFVAPLPRHQPLDGISLPAVIRRSAPR
jgi:hypothetical protein